ETKEGLKVLADMHGIERDAIRLSVEDGLLTIQAAAPQSANGNDYVYREFETAGYFRQFQLGEKIDQTRIQADYRNGVLHLRLPFAEAAKPRQIPVKAA